MSYCRFSSDNMMSDVYVYADFSGGFTTHVASNRLNFRPIPKPSYSMIIMRGEFDKEKRQIVYKNIYDEFVAFVTLRVYRILCIPHELSLRFIKRQNIGLQSDGMTYNHDTAGECADNLEHLRAMGYRVPQYAIDRLRDEQEESK